MMVPPPTMLPVRTVTVLAPGKLAVPLARHSALDVRNWVPASMVAIPGSALTTTSFVELSAPLVTVRRNVRSTNCAGIVNEATAAFAPARATTGVPIWVHWKVTAPVDGVPFNVTEPPWVALISACATAATGCTGGSTVKEGPPLLGPFALVTTTAPVVAPAGHGGLDRGVVDHHERRLIRPVERHRRGADEPGTGDGDAAADGTVRRGEARHASVPRAAGAPAPSPRTSWRRCWFHGC